MTEIELTGLPALADTPMLRRALQDRLQARAADWLASATLANQGGLVDPADLAISVLGVAIDEHALNARVGVFFTELVGGCNCHDDPASHPGYAQLEVAIVRSSGRVQVRARSAAS